MKKTPRSDALKNRITGSMIFSFLFFIVDKLVFFFKNSLFHYIMSQAEQVNGWLKSSFIYNIFYNNGKKSVLTFSKKIKNSIAKRCEQSVILNFFNKMFAGILDIPVKTLAVGLFSFGFYSLIIYFIQVNVVKSETVTFIDLIINVGFMGIGAVLFFFRNSLYETIENSFFFGFIFFDFLGFRKRQESKTSAEKKYLLYYAVGMFFGILTFFVPVIYLCAGVVGTVMLVLMLSRPEVGLYAVLIGVPFLPTMGLAGMIILVSVCFFLKYIRGKRSVEFHAVDLFVLLFGIVVLCGGIFSITPQGSVKPSLLYLCFLIFYFPAVNLIKSPEIILRSAGCVMFSCVAVSLYGVAQNYFGIGDTTWQDAEMFSAIEGRVISTFGNPNVLAEYLVLILPFFIAFMFLKKGARDKIVFLSLTGVSFLCLIFTWSRGSWLSFAASVLILLVIMNKNFLMAYIGALFLVPFAPLVLPESIMSRIYSIGNLGDSSTSYRVSIWQASVNLIKDHFISGIGIGLEPFRLVYPEYALAGIEGAPHSHSLYFQTMVEYGIVGMILFVLVIFLFAQLCFTAFSKSRLTAGKYLIGAGFCGIAAFMINGVSDYVWYNYRVYLMFWIIFSITAAVSKFCIKDASAMDAE